MKDFSARISRLTVLDKNEMSAYRHKMKSESDRKKTENVQNKIWKRSVRVDLTVSNFARVLKCALNNVKETNSSDVDAEATDIKLIKKNPFFNANQKQDIQTALEIINARKRDKENTSMNVKKKETIVETLSKTRDVFLLKTTTNIIENELSKLDNKLAKEREDLSMLVKQSGESDIG